MHTEPIAYSLSSTGPGVDRLGSFRESPAWYVDDDRKRRPKRSITFDRDDAVVGSVENPPCIVHSPSGSVA